MAKTKRPKSFRVGRFCTVRVVRGPHPDNSDQWYWRADVTEAGGRTSFKVPWGTPADAEEYVTRRLADGGLDRAGPEGLRTVTRLLEDWLGEQVERVAAGQITQGTYDVYHRHALALSRGSLGRMDPARLTSDTLKTHWRGEVRHARKVNSDRRARAASADAETATRSEVQGPSVRTVAMRQSVLSFAWTWARSAGLVPDRELHREPIRPTKADRVYVDHTPSEEEFAAVLAAFQRAPWAADILRVQAVFGCRIGALARLLRSEVHLDGKPHPTLRLFCKGHDRTDVTLLPDALSVLRKYMDGDPSGRVFDCVKFKTARLVEPLEAACERAGVTRFTTHGVRRMACRRFIRERFPINVYVKLTGHTPAEALRLYTEAQPDDIHAAFAAAGMGGAEAPVGGADNVVPIRAGTTWG